MRILAKLIRFTRKSPHERLLAVRNNLRQVMPVRRLEESDWYWKVHKPGNDRTAYVIGLFGTGQSYINELMRLNIGERAKYLRDYKIRLHPGPTSMIYRDRKSVV